MNTGKKKPQTPKPATPKSTPKQTTSKTPTPLKSILKKPKPDSTPTKITTAAAQKPSPKSILKKVASPAPLQKKTKDDDITLGAFGLDESEEDGFDVASKAPKSQAVKSAKKNKIDTPAKSPNTKGSVKKKTAPQVPVLSESDDDADNAEFPTDDEDEEDFAPSQMKNWKALASKTLTMDSGPKTVTPKSKTSNSDLGAGLPSVPRSGAKAAENKTNGKTNETKPLKQKAASPETKVSAKKVKTEVKQQPPQKVQMFDDSEDDDDDEAALDYDDDGEGDEGDEQEAAIMRALHTQGDFTDLIQGQQPLDEGEGDEGNEDDDYSDDYENEDLPFEKAAKRLAAMEARVDKEANEEMQTNLQEMQTFKLPSGQEIEQEKLSTPDLTLLNQRIQDVLFTLSDFRTKRETERSRTEYMECLARDLTTYYGYLPELIDRFLEMFSPAEAVEFLMANEAQRPVTLRVNSLKTRRADLIQSLSRRGIHVEPLADWTKVGCKVTMSKLPLGATPEYLAGYYVLQSAASFLPVMALAPQENERVLDMCASPGGKATYISALMKNTGLLVANDTNTKRLPSLTGNIHRLGVRNSVVTNFDGRKLRNHFGLFDRILLDAPCSGLGVISKDPSVKTSKTNKDIQRASHIQKELALAAIDMLDAESKTGGYLVYSTCSIAVEENEEVVDYILSHRHVKLVETNIPFGVVGMTRYRTKQFHPSLSLTRRFYPHVHNMDGFFVCKIKKLADGPKTLSSSTTSTSASSSSDSSSSSSSSQSTAVPMQIETVASDSKKKKTAKKGKTDGGVKETTKSPVQAVKKPVNKEKNNNKPAVQPKTAPTTTTETTTKPLAQKRKQAPNPPSPAQASKPSGQQPTKQVKPQAKTDKVAPKKQKVESPALTQKAKKKSTKKKA